MPLTRPDVLLRAEALAELFVYCVAYQHLLPRHWGLFALLFLVPDIGLIPYAFNQNTLAARLYNLCHWSALPLVVGTYAFFQHRALLMGIMLIWLAHIAFDRSLGYGLKYRGVFKTTHIQRAAEL